METEKKNVYEYVTLPKIESKSKERIENKLCCGEFVSPKNNGTYTIPGVQIAGCSLEVQSIPERIYIYGKFSHIVLYKL